MAKISEIEAREILDSREKPTVEVKIITDDGLMATDSVPSGTSTGSFEAKALEPKEAIENINSKIKPKLIGRDPARQEEIDNLMLDLDGTENKEKLGANAILGVSLACARVAALTNKMPLFWHLNKLYQQVSGEKIEPSVPTPMMVMIEGGKHAKNNICMQEFLAITTLEHGRKIWQALKKILEEKKQKTELGLEGGFMPAVKFDEDAIAMLVTAIEAAKLKIPQDVKIGLDVAANNCQIGTDDILSLMSRYPVYSLEDPASEDAWEKWAQMKLELDDEKKEYLLIGDDLFVTNKKRLEKGINNLVANGIIIKVNQTGSLWETLQVIALARKNGYAHILSHRSGETMDTFIADLAVATGAKFIKSGAPFASERMVKYRRLDEIASEL